MITIIVVSVISYLVVGTITANVAEYTDFETATDIPSAWMLIAWPILVTIAGVWVICIALNTIVVWPARKINTARHKDERINTLEDRANEFSTLLNKKQNKIEALEETIDEIKNELELRDKLIEVTRTKKLTKYQEDKITAQHIEERSNKEHTFDYPLVRTVPTSCVVHNTVW